MALGGGNPQLEDGFARIANEILEAIARTPLTDYESRCVHYLWRKTYGWHNKSGTAKKTDAIAYSQWADGTGIDRRTVWRTLDNLVTRNIITRVTIKKPGTNPVTIWGFQKKYKDWVGYAPKLSAVEPTLEKAEKPQEVSAELPTPPVQVSAELPTGPVQVSQKKAKVSAESPTEVSAEMPKTIDKKDNSITKDKKGAQGPKAPDPLHPLRQKVFEELKKRRGYNSPVPGGEAAAITWMLKQGYSVEQIMTAHDKLKKDKFWASKFLDMQTVKKQIGELVKGKPAGQLPTTDELVKSWKGGKHDTE